ncbi:MAG: hypothetical protein WC516_01765 [Patescibacteria group bacterium]
MASVEVDGVIAAVTATQADQAQHERHDDRDGSDNPAEQATKVVERVERVARVMPLVEHGLSPCSSLGPIPRPHIEAETPKNVLPYLSYVSTIAK